LKGKQLAIKIRSFCERQSETVVRKRQRNLKNHSAGKEN